MMTCVDFHSHILPGVDDGSRSPEESLEMLRMEKEQGIRQVIATPHFYAHSDNPERFLKRREAAWQSLKMAMADLPDLPEIILGAEVYYFPGMSESEALQALTIGGKPMILLEMPDSPWTEGMYREMEAIYVKQGITPVIAHVDRYIGPFRTYGIPGRLEELPVLVQANASFFLTPRTGRMALRMLREKQIHLLGSDCHDPVTRKPNLGAALGLVEKKLEQSAFRHIHEYENLLLK